jgi:hypothetical protein
LLMGGEWGGLGERVETRSWNMNNKRTPQFLLTYDLAPSTPLPPPPYSLCRPLPVHREKKASERVRCGMIEGVLAGGTVVGRSQ